MTLQEAFDQGMALHQRGRLVEAERIYREVLQRQPDHAGALHLLGLIALQNRHAGRAVELIGKAIRLNAGVAAAHNNLGKALLDLKRPERALASFDQAIALEPGFAMAHNNRGNALLGLKRPEEALASCEQAIALVPELAMAHNNRGMALNELKRSAEALASLDRAIALEPNLAEAHSNRASALLILKRSEDALASCDKAIALMPTSALAHDNRGSALLDLKRPEEALASYDKAIALEPGYALAHSNRGKALEELERRADALASFDRAIALEPDLVLAHYNRGRALQKENRYDEAVAAYDRALALDPDLTGLKGSRLNLKMQNCDWSNFDSECDSLISNVRNGKPNSGTFVFFSIPSSSADQLQCAKLSVAREYPVSHKPIWRGERYGHDRVRVAYLSPDFRMHATAFLVDGMFECHDRSRFETTAIACGPDDKSELRRRMEESFDRFIDAQTYSDDRIARLARELEIDIFVDLAGFTEGSRTNVFARRSAPVQVNFLCYPGTMGAPYIDYIIADRIVIPENQREFFAEKVVVLPNSYQVNDAKRAIADKTPERSEMGLPPKGFVFCCFNNNHKITPHVFDSWMRILKQVDDSVLWLLGDNARAASNLNKEAAARGVDTARLVFAKRMPPPDHLARHRLADLFLDTLPYNAHTTASDALWAGLPVVTRLGETFAGRVAASLLNAIGLPELVTTNSAAYEQMAVDLATHPEKLAAIRRKLAGNRLTAPLFDTRLFTRHIEAAYTVMYRRHQAGLPPDHIVVAD
jgi:protein O-GlcNAc transferase